MSMATSQFDIMTLASLVVGLYSAVIFRNTAIAASFIPLENKLFLVSDAAEMICDALQFDHVDWNLRSTIYSMTLTSRIDGAVTMYQCNKDDVEYEQSDQDGAPVESFGARMFLVSDTTELLCEKLSNGHEDQKLPPPLYSIRISDHRDRVVMAYMCTREGDVYLNSHQGNNDTEYTTAPVKLLHSLLQKVPNNPTTVTSHIDLVAVVVGVVIAMIVVIVLVCSMNNYQHRSRLTTNSTCRPHLPGTVGSMMKIRELELTTYLA